MNDLIYPKCLGVRITAVATPVNGSGYVGPMNQRAADMMLNWAREGNDVTVEFNPRMQTHRRRSRVGSEISSGTGVLVQKEKESHVE